MKDGDRRKQLIILGLSSACAMAVGYATVAERAEPPAAPITLSDASSFLNLFTPVQAPATIPGGER